jgi:acyl carrier protein
MSPERTAEMEQEIRSAVKTYILKEFLPGEDPAELKDDTPLITGGILDSLATIKLVTFVEDRYGIAFQAHEADVEHLNTVSDIASMVLSKLARNPAS